MLPGVQDTILSARGHDSSIRVGYLKAGSVPCSASLVPSTTGTITAHWRSALFTATLLNISHWQKICTKYTALRNSEKGEDFLSCQIALESKEISLPTRAGFDADQAKPRELLCTRMDVLSSTASLLSVLSVTHVSEFQVRP